MATVAPAGPVYQAGTLSGNPLAMAAGAATLDLLEAPGTYERLEALSARLEAGLRRRRGRRGATVTINRVGSMITVFFCAGPVRRLRDGQGQRHRALRPLLPRHARSAASTCPPAQFEAAFVSLAHTEADIDATTRAAQEALAGLLRPGLEPDRRAGRDPLLRGRGLVGPGLDDPRRPAPVGKPPLPSPARRRRRASAPGLARGERDRAFA